MFLTARNIPAHAGKTTAFMLLILVTWEHPRSRGENRVSPTIALIIHGTSPLTRGKPIHRDSPAARRRNIPAHAGKTDKRARTIRPCREHPRSRGENRMNAYWGGREFGTSPLTRGKRALHGRERSRRRNIPAHAGKTGSPPLEDLSPEEHPRSRGENTRAEWLAQPKMGTSPLTRGKRLLTSRVQFPVKDFISLRTTSMSGTTPFSRV